MCCNLPFNGRVKTYKRKARLSPREKTSGVATNVYLRENIRKTKKRYANFENKGLGVVYA